MTWEWLAAPVVGLAGIISTYLAGGRQQQTALAVVRQQTDVQVAVAREERQQRRLEEAYLETLTALSHIYYWVFAVYPPITQTPEQYTMPPLPELPDNARKEAAWTAYWSPRVEQLMDEWQLTVRKLQHAGMSISMARAAEAKGQQSGLDHPTLALELPGLKQAVVDADKSVRNQVRLELLGQSDGHAENVPPIEVAKHERGRVGS